MKGVWNFYFLLGFLLKFKDVSAANILFMSIMPGRSHQYWDKTIANILIDRGHNITMLTHFPEVVQTNFTTVHLEGFFETYCQNETWQALSELSFHQMLWSCEFSCNIYIKSNGFNTIMQQAKDGVKYDLIFFDLTSGPCLWPVIKLFGSPPIIGTSAFGIVPYVARSFGVSSQTAYNPFYTLPYSNEMTFYQRFINYFTHIYELILKDYYWTRTMNLQKQFFENIEHYSEYERNFSLLFANYDPVLDYPKPLPPNVIPLGGLHLREAKPLPKDLKSYMDSSEKGVIIMSLGSVIQSNKMNTDFQEMFLSAFSKLDENVIWKYESDISILPVNVKSVKYLPQIDMLAHPNVKVFIGHGGALSTQEAMYFGVPFIGIPLYLDQHSNVARVVQRKIGLGLNYHNLTSSYILETIREVIRNPIYKSNAKKISHYYRTLPDRPRDQVIHYTEHVIKEGGTLWLRPTGADMTFYQLNLLDVWFTVLAIMGILLWVGVKIVIGVWRRFGRKLVIAVRNGEQMKKKVM